MYPWAQDGHIADSNGFYHNEQSARNRQADSQQLRLQDQDWAK